MKAKRGFTIVEMLAVIAVLGILMGIVVGLAAQASRKADVAKAQTDLQVIRDALEAYRLRNGEYPLHSRFDQTMRDNARDWHDRTKNRDPWGSDYQYRRIAPLEYHLWSMGSSRQHSVAGIPLLPVQGSPENRDNITR